MIEPSLYLVHHAMFEENLFSNSFTYRLIDEVTSLLVVFFVLKPTSLNHSLLFTVLDFQERTLCTVVTDYFILSFT